MVGLGTIINFGSILVGGTLGLVLKNFLPKRLSETILQGVGLAVLFIGFGGALSAGFKITDGEISTRYTLLMVLSLAIGALIGELLRIEQRLDSFANAFEKKFTKQGEASTFAQGFVTTTLLFCVGAMAIVGSIEDGINSNATILIAKSLLDGITAMVFASTLGIGVLFSAVSVVVYQGSITLLAVFVAPYLNEQVVSQMSFIGSILIAAIGFNMLNIAKIKVGNLLPAILIPIVYSLWSMLTK